MSRQVAGVGRDSRRPIKPGETWLATALAIQNEIYENVTSKVNVASASCSSVPNILCLRLVP
jgi:hypothetical protein